MTTILINQNIENNTTNIENDTTNIENDTTNIENDTTNIENDTTNIENDTTNIENDTTNIENDTTNIENDTTNIKKVVLNMSGNQYFSNEINILKKENTLDNTPETIKSILKTNSIEEALSLEQRNVLEKYIDNVNIFVTGPGGTGKSYVLKRILNIGLNNKKSIQVCAMSGRAAVLLNCKAKTIHSWCGLGIAIGSKEEIIRKAIKKRKVIKNWRSIHTLIIDEVSMMSKKMFELLNEIGKIIRKNNKPFGGVQLIFIGDFYQLPPIGDTDDEDSAKYCFESDEWSITFAQENHVKLTQIFRQKEDKNFIKILSQVREGRITRSSHETLSSIVGRKYNEETDKHKVAPTRLFPLRISADNLNMRMFNEIDKPINTYKYNTITNFITYQDDGTNIPSEILNECRNLNEDNLQREIKTLLDNSPCVPVLQLKEGCLVMLTYNLNTETGLCNGSQGIVIGFSSPTVEKPNSYPIVRFANGIINTITEQTYQSLNYPLYGFSQIPLKLAWGLTIHSSQGATLDTAEIDIGSGIFEVGQTYVALSRVKSLDGLYLLGYDPTKIKISRKVVDFYNTF